VAVVDPNHLNINRLPPPVVIQQVIADKKPITNSTPFLAVAEKIIIPPGRGELEVHYEALSFCAPAKNQFRYKLGGMDLNWVDAGTRRVAYYNNLRPGSYHFQVMACNNDGVWSNANASVLLTFRPHFWQTWWFLSLMVAGTVGTVGGAARYITNQRMQRKLEALARQNAIEKERTRIARDMHDELGAKLTRISFLGNTAQMSPSLSPESNQQIRKMSEAARELILSLDQIVWAVDPENDSLENLANYICRHASEFTANSSVQCQYKIPLKLPACNLSTDVRHNVFLTVKEALTNALKHSGATEIVIAMSARDKEFEITIGDNGHGLALDEPAQQKAKRTGRGLANMRERLKSIGGQLTVTSHPGRGTKITLNVPLQR
jgi:signal transduction histidine kinase